MNKTLGTIFLSVVVLLFAATLSFASTVPLDLGYTFSGTAPDGTSPWLTATFDDEGSAGSVMLTLNAGNLIDNEFVSNWYLNFNTMSLSNKGEFLKFFPGKIVFFRTN